MRPVILLNRTAMRIVGIEYLQNFPILLGLMAAIKTSDWLTSILFAGLGAVGTAVTIMLTESIKLREHAPQRPTPLIVNVLTFFAGSAVYLAYFRLLRAGMTAPLTADILLGCLLGLLMGLSQGYGRGEGRLNAGDIAHILGLMAAGIALCAVIGLVADAWPPFLAALILCIPMTLIIVRLDYWSLITSS